MKKIPRILLTLLLSALFALTSFATPPRPLLKHAKLLLTLTNYQDKVGAISSYLTFMNAHWLSKNVVLAHSRFGDGLLMVPYTLDLTTGRLGILNGLHDVINDCKPAGWELSSDGKWILWKYGWFEPKYQFVATRLDGSKSVRWEVTRDFSEGVVYWLGKTHKWVHLLGNKAYLFDLDHPNRKRALHVPSVKAEPVLGLLGMLPDGSVLLTDWDENGRHRNRIIKLRIIRNRVFVNSWTATTPGNGHVSGLRLSPDGKHLAWLITKMGKSKEDCSKHPIESTLSISNLRGKHTRVIGTLPTTADDEYITYLHGWFPDNRRVLFQYRSRLYSVATNGK